MALTGEKMNETEIESLMQGQEDENGSIPYEGTYSKNSSNWTFVTLSRQII